jgi:hypothetical protein
MELPLHWFSLLSYGVHLSAELTQIAPDPPCGEEVSLRAAPSNSQVVAVAVLQSRPRARRAGAAALQVHVARVAARDPRVVVDAIPQV